MNAPPTPPLAPGDLPADTETEATLSSAHSASAENASAPVPPSDAFQVEISLSHENPYETVFPQLISLAAAGEHKEIIQIAEKAELIPVNEGDVRRLFIKTPLVLSYLILDDLPPAKFVLTRLPDSIASKPLPQSLFNIFASVWERKYENVYPRAEALMNLAHQSDFPESLASLIATLVTQFVGVESFRRRTFALISRAYSSIPLSLAQAYMGLGQEELLAVAEVNRWTYEASSQILTPAPAAGPRSTYISAPSTLKALDLITDSVALLDA